MSPFIVVSYFSLQSMFNRDLKGLIYLSGLLITCIIASSISANMPDSASNGNINPACAITYLGIDSQPLSKNIPLSLVVLSYTFWYIFFIIARYNLHSTNVSFYLIFIVLILGDVYWQYSKKCISDLLTGLGTSFSIGAICGVIWAAIIDSSGYIDLQLFNGVSSAEVCSAPTRKKYKCKIVNKPS